MKNCISQQQQDKSYRYALRRASCFNAPICRKRLYGRIRSNCKKPIASRTNRIVMHSHVLRASLRCCFIHFCLDQSDRITKSLIASRANRIVMRGYVPIAPMRRCVITCCLDISNRMDIETYYVFHCAAMSSSDIFGTAVSIAVTKVLHLNFSANLFSCTIQMVS